MKVAPQISVHRFRVQGYLAFENLELAHGSISKLQYPKINIFEISLIFDF
jgi:hypothetical protein